MAVATGPTIANVYCNQPILAKIAASLGVSEAAGGAVSVFGQIGFGRGLFLVAPLGDMTNRRALVLSLETLLGLAKPSCRRPRASPPMDSVRGGQHRLNRHAGGHPGRARGERHLWRARRTTTQLRSWPGSLEPTRLAR